MVSRKNGRPSWIQTIALCLAVAAISVFVTGYVLTEKQTDTSSGGYAKLDEIKKLVDRYYVGTYTDQELTDMLSAGYIAGINDKWAYYTSAEDMDEWVENTTGVYTGIGVSVTLDTDTGLLRVLDVYEGSPAAEAGLKPLDMLYKVGDEYVAELGMNMTVAKVRGEAGTTVDITILRGSDEIRYTVERRQVTKSSVYAEIIDGNIGYLRITEFTQAAAAEYKTKLSSLISAGAEGIVFDVRNNPGGQLNTLLAMLDDICPAGPLFIQEDKQGNRDVLEASDDTYYATHIAVLVNRYSYSAAEYFGAVLQEKGLASVVGEKTTGKGEAQRTYTLSDGSAVTFSVLKYFTPNGVRISEKGGIVPDIEVAMDDSLTSKIGALDKESDTQLAAAVDAVKKMIGE